MSRVRTISLAIAILCPAPASAQQSTSADFVDFNRDVKPIFREKCTECHGGNQHQGGLRLDVGRLAMIGSTDDGTVIIPGNSDRSRLVWRISGGKFGPQMPPTGALRPDQIEAIKRWIDQGAPWPAAERMPQAVDDRITRLGSAFRRGDRAAITRATADAGVVNLTGREGMTALIYAALYGSAADLKALLEHGANPNAQSDDGLSPLMLAAFDAAKVHLLLTGGADPNLRSEDGRTALHIAAEAGALDAVRQLLEAGARVNFTGSDSPLALAAQTGNVDLIRLLLDAGAPMSGQAGVSAMVSAAVIECAPCIDVLATKAEPTALGAALSAAANESAATMVNQLLAKGASIDAKFFAGATPLMLAAVSERDAIAKVRLLLERGADLNAKSDPAGDTAADFAMRRGDHVMIELLQKKGPSGIAEEERQTPTVSGTPPNSLPRPGQKGFGDPNVLSERIARSIAMLMRSSDQFVKNTGCMSCHHQVLPSVLSTLALRKRVNVDADVVERHVRMLSSHLEDRRSRALQGFDIAAGGPDGLSYLLFALDVASAAPSETTEAWARYLMMVQLPDGHWRIVANRPPLESSDIEVTALSLRALVRYAPACNRAFYDERVRAAGTWLINSRPTTNEERAFRLLGLVWAGAPQTTIAKAVRELRAAQRPDGGWAQIDTRDSDAYATGQALYALHEAGRLKPTDPGYRRGVQFLLDTQQEDGTWHVATRTVPFQPLFDSGFPYGRDQWISAAGTSWASIALTLALP